LTRPNVTEPPVALAILIGMLPVSPTAVVIVTDWRPEPAVIVPVTLPAVTVRLALGVSTLTVMAVEARLATLQNAGSRICSMVPLVSVRTKAETE